MAYTESILIAERDSWKSTAESLARALRLLSDKVRDNVDMTACEVIGDYWLAVEALRSYDSMFNPKLTAKK